MDEGKTERVRPHGSFLTGNVPRRISGVGVLAALIAFGGGVRDVRCGPQETDTTASQESEAPEESLFEELELFRGETPYLLEAGVGLAKLLALYSVSDELNELEIPLSLTYGVTDRVELSALLPYKWRDGKQGEPDTRGITDIELSAIYGIVLKQTALKVALKLPTGDAEKGLGDDALKFVTSVLFARNVYDGRVYWRLGVEVSEDDVGGEYSLAAAHPVGWDAVVLVQLEGTALTEENEASLAPGIVWRGPSDTELGAGVLFGLTEASPDYGLFIEAAINF